MGHGLLHQPDPPRGGRQCALCPRLLGWPGSESGTLCHGDGSHEGGDPLPEGAPPSDAVVLFDGKNLDHFNKIGDANWRIEDGAAFLDQHPGAAFVVARLLAQHFIDHNLAFTGFDTALRAVA